MKYSVFAFFVAMILGQSAHAYDFSFFGSSSGVKVPARASTDSENGAVQNYIVDQYQANPRNSTDFKPESVNVGNEDPYSHNESVTAIMGASNQRRTFVIHKNYDYGIVHYSIVKELAAPAPPAVDTPEPSAKYHCRPGECWNTSSRASSVK